MISFIIPAKNVEQYIEPCLCPFIKNHNNFDFEVIIIDDHSTDATYTKIYNISAKYPRIKVFKNNGQGKVQALNYGYSLSSGQIIKCIDSDDIISEEIFPLLVKQTSMQVIMHDATIVDEKLNKICHFTSSSEILSDTYENVLRKILSPPRWTWSFSRLIADYVFPMPLNLPYEDIWFSFSIKKYAHEIKYIPHSYYLYRQHSNQTFGGVYNFSEKIVRFRANRLVNILPIIQNSKLGEGIDSKVFNENISFYKYISNEDWNIISFIKLRSTLNKKIRFLLILFFPKYAKMMQSLLWKIRKK